MNTVLGFTGGADSEDSACDAGDPSLILGSGRLPREGSGYSFQYSCPENPMDRGYSPWGCKDSDMTELVSTESGIHIHISTLIWIPFPFRSP